MIDAYTNNINELLTSKEGHPVISIVVLAKNEEINSLRCIYSLSKNKSTVPFEIIVIDNGSTDRTILIAERLNIQLFYQPVAGVGAARELGQINARGLKGCRLSLP